MCVRVGARARTGELFHRERLCFARLHVIRDDTESESSVRPSSAADPLQWGTYASHAGAFFGKNVP